MGTLGDSLVFILTPHVSPQDLYSSRDLQGLTVEHDVGAFREGETLVLTLKDKGEQGGTHPGGTGRGDRAHDVPWRNREGTLHL